MTTTRLGGVSKSPFNSLNLAHHVGDDPDSVKTNREILRRDWLIPSEPYWLNQTHSTDVIEIDDKTIERDGDAAWTCQQETVCAVMTADCLPLLLYQGNPDRVAAIHAGWRGLEAGVIENTVAAMSDNPESIQAWLGPAIGPSSFEVGSEVREAFIGNDKGCVDCFRPSTNDGKYMANIYHLAKRRLNALGITEITGGDYCTVLDQELFYSYRRDGQTGRMATLIWLDE